MVIPHSWFMEVYRTCIYKFLLVFDMYCMQMMFRKVVESPSLKMLNKLVVVELRDMVRGEHGSAVLTVILMILEVFWSLNNSMVLILNPSKKISATHIPGIYCPGKLHTKFEKLKSYQPYVVVPCWLYCQCVGPALNNTKTMSLFSCCLLEVNRNLHLNLDPKNAQGVDSTAADISLMSQGLQAGVHYRWRCFLSTSWKMIALLNTNYTLHQLNTWS